MMKNTKNYVAKRERKSDTLHLHIAYLSEFKRRSRGNVGVIYRGFITSYLWILVLLLQ
jgi:hypothetical protein